MRAGEFNDPRKQQEAIIKSKENFICLDCLDTSDHLIKKEDIVRMPKRTKLLPECQKCSYSVNGYCSKSRVGDKLYGRDPDFIPIDHRCVLGKSTKDGNLISMSELCCPLCKKPVRRIVGKPIIISIVGSRDSGKSHYIGVLLHELMASLASDFGWDVQSEEETIQNYRKNFGGIYDYQQTLNLTQKNDDGFYDPYIYFVNPRNQEPFTLIFFDTAGEDFASDNLIENSAKHIFQANGIIFIIDPLKTEALSTLVDDRVIAESSHNSIASSLQNDQLLTMVSTSIRKHLRISEEKSINIPLALTLSKFDALEKQFPAYNTVVNSSVHRRSGAYSEQDCENVNKEVVRFLLKQQNMRVNAFMNQMDINYCNYHYFAVSALGLRNHPMHGRISVPKPHRVEDPMLWILKENNVI
jgi:hypothetical protein